MVRFSEKQFLNTKCVMFFSIDFSETFVILRRIRRDIIIYLGRFLRNLTVILVYFNDS